jgi:hypothetical protein
VLADEAHRRPRKKHSLDYLLKILDTTVSPVDAQALFADDLLLIPKWIIDLWKDNADVAVSKSNGEIPSGLSECAVCCSL